MKTLLFLLSIVAAQAATITVLNSTPSTVYFRWDAEEDIIVYIPAGATTTFRIDEDFTSLVTIQDTATSAYFKDLSTSEYYDPRVLAPVGGDVIFSVTVISSELIAERTLVPYGSYEKHIEYFIYGFTTMGVWELGALGLLYLKFLRRSTGEGPS